MQRRGSRIDPPADLPKDEVFFPRSWDLPQVKGVAMIAGKRRHDDFGVALALIFAVVVSSSAPAGAVDSGYARNLWWNADGTRYLHLNATGTPNAGFLAVIDAATGLITHDRIPIGTLPGDEGFDPVDPNVLYYHASSTIHKVTLNVDGTWQDAVYFTAPGAAALASLGSTINWLDASGRYVVVRYGPEPSVRLYDRLNMAAGPYGNVIDGSRIIDKGSYIGITPDGQFLVDIGQGVSWKIDHAGRSVAAASMPLLSMTINGSLAPVADTATATASASAGTVGVQFKLDGANFGAEVTTAPYAVSWSTAPANSSSRRLSAVSRDAAGNQTTSAAVTVVVSGDTTPPVISSVTASTITASGATIAWTTNEASDSQVDYGLTTAYGTTSVLNATLVTAHSVSLSGLTGSTLYHVRVRSRDAAGNLALSGDITLTTLAAPDLTPPTVSITAPAGGATVSGTATVTATASDNVGVAGVQFKVDGAALGTEVTAAPYSVSWNTRGSADLVFGVTKVAVGPMTISAGTAFTRRLSVTCPSCTGDDTLSEDKIQSAAGSATATFTFSGPAHYLAQVAAFKAASTPVYVQGATATSNTSGTTIAQAFAAPATAGNLIVVIVGWQTNTALTVTDSQGNSYAVATTAYDAVNGQSLSILYAANARGGATTVTAGFGAATPSVRRLEIHEYAGLATTNPLDGTATNIADAVTTADAVTSGAAATTVISPAPDGSHTLTAVARDAAGNQTTSAAVIVTVSNDTTPPVISNVSTSAITATGATISWTTNEASNTQVEYGLTAAYGSTSALNATLVTAHSVSLSGLTGGTLYHVRVRSRDAAGNLALSSDTTLTTLDGTPPSVSITAPAAAAIVSGSVTVTATASDNVGVAGVQFQLDGAPLGSEDVLAPYTVAWNTTTASAGLHTLTAVARDAAGNRTTSAAVIVTVANSARQVSLAWDRNTEPNIAGYKVYVGTTSGVYGVPLDVGNVTTYTVTGVAAGTAYYISVTAYDQTGLESGFSNEVTAIIP